MRIIMQHHAERKQKDAPSEVAAKLASAWMKLLRWMKVSSNEGIFR